jgi:hypothetical protein
VVDSILVSMLASEELHEVFYRMSGVLIEQPKLLGIWCKILMKVLASNIEIHFLIVEKCLIQIINNLDIFGWEEYSLIPVFEVISIR